MKAYLNMITGNMMALHTSIVPGSAETLNPGYSIILLMSYVSVTMHRSNSTKCDYIS